MTRIYLTSQEMSWLIKANRQLAKDAIQELGDHSCHSMNEYDTECRPDCVLCNLQQRLAELEAKP